MDILPLLIVAFVAMLHVAVCGLLIPPATRARMDVWAQENVDVLLAGAAALVAVAWVCAVGGGGLQVADLPAIAPAVAAVRLGTRWWGARDERAQGARNDRMPGQASALVVRQS